MHSDLTHITIGYPRRGYMDLLAETARLHGCNHVAMPKHWPISPFGVINKITLLKSYLDTGDLDSGDIIMFTDAYDVTVIEHASVIVHKFLATGAAIIFSAESNFWPPEGRESVKRQFDEYESKWKYLNSGGYIGYVWAVRKLIDYCSERIRNEDYDFHKPDDQALFQRFFLEHRGSRELPVALDIQPTIFCSLNASNRDFVFSRGQVIGTRTGGTVSVLHANGGKHNMDIIRRHWELSGGSEGAIKRRDLRVATADGHPLAYDSNRSKLVPAGPENEFPAIFLVKGNQLAICLSDAHGMLTFSPEGGLLFGAEVVNVWEVVGVCESVTTYHGSGLEAYCDVPAGSVFALAPMPLTVLLRDSFDALLENIRRYEARF